MAESHKKPLGRPKLSSDEERRRRIRESKRNYNKKYQQTNECKIYRSIYQKNLYLNKQKHDNIDLCIIYGLNDYIPDIEKAKTTQELRPIKKMLNNYIMSR